MIASTTASRDTALDGLRGLAALAVLCGHVGSATVGGVSAPLWLLWPAEGGAAVLIFFVLSGYVIGLTNPPTGAKDVKLYVSRRLLRLMPINLVAVLLACAVTAQVDPWVALENVFFLGNSTPYAGVSVPIIANNENLWSLNYELVYYALFIVIWLRGSSLVYVAGLSVAVALLGWYTPWVPLFAACYAAGFLFWIAGLALAWHAPPSGREHSNWPSAVLLFLVTWKVRGLFNLLAVFPMPLFTGPVVRPYYWDVLPACLWLFCAVARRPVPYLGWLKAASALIPLVGLTITWRYFAPLDRRLAWGAYLLALLLWNWRPSLRGFRVFAPLGAIAFGLYATARPIQAWAFAHGQWLPASYLGFGLWILATLILCLGVAWVLEHWLQPRLNRLFRRAPAVK